MVFCLLRVKINYFYKKLNDAVKYVRVHEWGIYGEERINYFAIVYWFKIIKIKRVPEQLI